MKRLLTLALLVVGPVLSGCSDLSITKNENAVRDTLFRTVRWNTPTPVDSTLYVLVWKNPDGTTDTTLSTTPSPFDSVPLQKLLSTAHSGAGRIYLTTCDTILLVAHHVGAIDTVYVEDSSQTTRKKYWATVVESLPAPLDSPDSYLRQHPPRISNKDTLVNTLKTVPEGYARTIPLTGTHYYNDSMEIVFADKPSWLTLTWANSGCSILDGRRYSRCDPALSFPIVGTCFKSSEFSLPTLTIFCDSTMVDSTYHWQMILRNKYGAADTVSFTSYAQRDSCLLD
jgi:hypothetical protein